MDYATALRPPRGQTEQAWFDRMRRIDADADPGNPSEFFQLMQEAFDNAAEFDLKTIGFRHSAPSTQKRQDRILEDYRRFVRHYRTLDDDVDEDELDRACFPPATGTNEPECFNDLWRTIRPYLYMVTLLKTPRSNAHDHVSYTTLCQYREVVMFWTPRKYNARGEKPPGARHVFNQMTEMLRALALQFRLVRVNTLGDKTNVGLDDIRQLIDMDVRDTVSIELSEQHHFAICLARACALRPHSLAIGPNSKYSVDTLTDDLPFLAWKDLRITSSHAPGMWTLRVTIRNLKTNKTTDAERAVRENKTLVFRITSPQQQSNLALSVPHRALVIGIRRGVFDGINTIDELFESGLHEIPIKQEFRDKPVLLAGKERGLGLKDDSTPLPTLSLTKWIKLRAERMGWPGNVTFYSIRRQTGADYVRTLGVDGARALMGHEPDSRSLERFYVDRVHTVDVSAIGLDEETGNTKASEFLRLEASAGMTLDRLPPALIIRTYGPELNALHRQYARADKDYSTLSGSARKNRDRALRRRAFLALRKEMVELHQKQQTQGERRIRREEILARATAFNQRLVQFYSEASGVLDNGEDEVEDLSTVDFDHDFDEAPAQENPLQVRLDLEDDAEDQTAVRDVEITVPEETQFSDQAVNYVEAAEAVPYAVAAKLAMQMMFDHELGQYQPQQGVTCSFCENDDTVSTERKEKTYTHGHLRQHVASDFHTRYKQWQRRAVLNKTDNYFYCPYCVEVSPDGDSHAFKALKDLLRHIRRSNKKHIANAGEWTTPQRSEKHERLKELDGWFDHDWAVNVSENVTRGTTHRAKVAHAARKLKTVKIQYSPPIDISGFPALVWAQPGQVVGDQQPISGVVVGPSPGLSGFASTFAGLPKHAGIIYDVPPPGAPGWTPTFTEPPRADIEIVPFPGTDGNMPGDGHLMHDLFMKHGQK